MQSFTEKTKKKLIFFLDQFIDDINGKFIKLLVCGGDTMDEMILKFFFPLIKWLMWLLYGLWLAADELLLSFHCMFAAEVPLLELVRLNHHGLSTMRMNTKTPLWLVNVYLLSQTCFFMLINIVLKRVSKCIAEKHPRLVYLFAHCIWLCLVLKMPTI